MKEGFLGMFEANNHVYYVFFTETETQVTFKIDIGEETYIIKCDKDKLETLLNDIDKKTTSLVNYILSKVKEFAYYAYSKYIMNPTLS